MIADTVLMTRITGRVQGVWFRGWTAEQASALGLRGWVRNCADGSVEALLIGAPEAVEAMVSALQHGPPAARVDRLAVAPASDDGSEGFRVLR